MKQLLFFLLLIVNAHVHAFEIDESQGRLVSYKLFRSYDKKGVAALWKEKGIPKFVAPVKYGVDIYEIIYMAPWVDGTMIRASGLYFVPKGKPGEKYPAAVYHHGTQLRRAREDFDKSAQQGITFGLAADGYLGIMPDYYGIGDGDKVHLYQHAWSEAMSTIYMLFAIDELNELLEVERNDQLFLTGYSQGGHATMAAHKYLQEFNHPRYQVTASAPLSGAYDMSGVQAEVMFQPYSQPFYLPYLLVSYAQAYEDVWEGDIYEIFRSPYDSIIPPFFEGSRDIKDFNKVLPKVPAEVIREELVDAFLNDPEFPMAKKIAKNNLYEWVPKAPMLLCYCEGDEQVFYKNSLVAHEWMKRNGAADVRLRKVSEVFGHNTCALFAVMDTRFFLDNMRKGKPNKKLGPPVKRMLINAYKKKEEKKYIEKLEQKRREGQDLWTEQ
jgi:pimeloyl-ACP methyl ester carboxylesterase